MLFIFLKNFSLKKNSTKFAMHAKNRTNGEFDIALELENGKYVIVEAKYYMPDHVLTLSQMRQEANQVSRIKELKVESVWFACASDFETQDEFRCIRAEEMYDPQIIGEAAMMPMWSV